MKNVGKAADRAFIFVERCCCRRALRVYQLDELLHHRPIVARIVTGNRKELKTPVRIHYLISLNTRGLTFVVKFFAFSDLNIAKARFLPS